MKDRIVWLMIMVICLAAAAQAGVDYAEPAGGWFYIMEGDSDVLADNWYEDNSEWDGTAPGTGYPMPGGVGSEPFFAFMEEIFQRLPMRGMDITEVAPTLDSNDMTSFLAVQVVLEALGAVKKS